MALALPLSWVGGGHKKEMRGRGKKKYTAWCTVIYFFNDTIIRFEICNRNYTHNEHFMPACFNQKTMYNLSPKSQAQIMTSCSMSTRSGVRTDSRKLITLGNTIWTGKTWTLNATTKRNACIQSLANNQQQWTILKIILTVDNLILLW